MSTITNDEIDKDKDAVRKFIRGLIFFIPIVLVLTIVFAWWQYPEPYEFFQEYVSNLGGQLSDTGIDNNVSSWIMVVGFSTTALITLAIAILYFVFRRLDYWYVKGPFCLFLTIGALGIAVPADLAGWRVIHYIGAFSFIFGFAAFNFTAQLVRFLRHWPEPNKMTIGFVRDTAMTILVLIAMVLFLLFYLLVKVSDVPDMLAPLGQKIVLIVDCIAAYFLDIEDM